MGEDRDKLREELLIEKEIRLDDLGNSQSVQTDRYAKIRRVTVRKTYSGEKAKHLARQPFVSALKGIRYHSIQSYRGH